MKMSLKHTIAIMLLVIFAAFALGSTASTPDDFEEEPAPTLSSNRTTTTGPAYNISPSPEARPYEVLGRVFATLVRTTDENGSVEVSSVESIQTLLLREAHKLGANDIVNIRVDENIQIMRNEEGTHTTVTFTGSAIAIRYRANP